MIMAELELKFNSKITPSPRQRPIWPFPKVE